MAIKGELSKLLDIAEDQGREINDLFELSMVRGTNDRALLKIMLHNMRLRETLRDLAEKE